MQELQKIKKERMAEEARMVNASQHLYNYY
jgi:hypothetical protein